MARVYSTKIRKKKDKEPRPNDKRGIYSPSALTPLKISLTWCLRASRGSAGGGARATLGDPVGSDLGGRVVTVGVVGVGLGGASISDLRRRVPAVDVEVLVMNEVPSLVVEPRVVVKIDVLPGVSVMVVMAPGATVIMPKPPRMIESGCRTCPTILSTFEITVTTGASS